MIVNELNIDLQIFGFNISKNENPRKEKLMKETNRPHLKDKVGQKITCFGFVVKPYTKYNDSLYTVINIVDSHGEYVADLTQTQVNSDTVIQQNAFYKASSVPTLYFLFSLAFFQAYKVVLPLKLLGDSRLIDELNKGDNAYIVDEIKTEDGKNWYKIKAGRKVGYILKENVDFYELNQKDEYVFVNAWNEWAEGMILEPTEDLKYKYLEWIKEFRENTKNEETL